MKATTPLSHRQSEAREDTLPTLRTGSGSFASRPFTMADMTATLKRIGALSTEQVRTAPRHEREIGGARFHAVRDSCVRIPLPFPRSPTLIQHPYPQVDAFKACEWPRAQRAISELKNVLEMQVKRNPPDAVALNPLIEQAARDLAFSTSKRAELERTVLSAAVSDARNDKATVVEPGRHGNAQEVPKPHTAATFTNPTRTDPVPTTEKIQTQLRIENDESGASRRSPRSHAPPGPKKAAKHDWGASTRHRNFGSDDDDDDVCAIEPPNLGGPQGSNKVLRNGGAQRNGEWQRGGGGRGGNANLSGRGGEATGGTRDIQGGSRRVSRGGEDAPRPGGFVSAAVRLDSENARKGLPPVRRDSGDTSNGNGNTNAIAGNGFVPPYVRKAFAGPGNANGNGQAQKKAAPGQQNNPDENEPPFCEQVMARLSPNGEPIPDVLLKMDKEIVEKVVAEILEGKSTVDWNAIAGLEHAKAAVQELAVWPLLKPELFRGARSVPRGLLLFGPPGTGKTLIGRAVASQCNATFFSISASSLTSKWIGEGEKMVKALFAVANCCEPAVIFVDEIDSLLSARKSDGEHESSRRMKTEFLVQMDGLGGDEGRVLLIGATNRPQELDDGARRRLAKQLYIPLPCEKARKAMVQNILNADKGVAHDLSDEDLDVITKKTDGYSGSDMKHLTQEAARAPLRELFQSAKNDSQNSLGVSPLAMRPIKLIDFKRASKQVRPSVTHADIEFHEKWNLEHGAMSLPGGGEEEEDDDW